MIYVARRDSRLFKSRVLVAQLEIKTQHYDNEHSGGSRRIHHLDRHFSGRKRRCSGRDGIYS